MDDLSNGMAGARNRRVWTFVLFIAGGGAFLAGAGLTGLVARFLSPDGIVEARTAALLWTVRVRLILLGAAALLAGGALVSEALRARLRRINGHHRSWPGVAGLVFVLAVAGSYVDPRLLSDLRPSPDAVEYAVSARRLLTDGTYTIVVGGETLPPRYSFGYPLLIVPFYRAFGAMPSNAVLCSLVLAGLTAALVYRTGERVWGRPAGVAAALLTLSSRAFIDASRSITSESAATLSAALSVWLLVRLAERDRPAWAWGLAGACIGAGAVVRFTHILFMIPAAGVVLLRLSSGDGPGAQDGRRVPSLLRFRDAFKGARLRGLTAAMASLGAGCAAALAPLLIHQAGTFGEALRTGYSLWVPYYFDAPGNAFRSAYALSGPAMGAALQTPNALFYGGLLAGWGRVCYGVPAAVFALIGAVVSLKGVRGPGSRVQGRAVVLFALGGTAVTALFHTFYFFAESRFLTPVVPPLMLLAGAGAVAAVDFRPSGWRRWTTAACNLLCVWMIVECLPASGAGGAASVSRRYEACRMIARRTEAGAAVVSGIDPLFFRETAGREVIPVSRRVEYASKIVLPAPIREAVPGDVAHDPARYTAWALARGARQAVPWTATEAPERVAAYVLEGRPVYCDDYDLRGDEAPLRERLRFEPVDSAAGVRLYRLRMP